MKSPFSLVRVAKTLYYLSTGRRRPVFPVSTSMCRELKNSSVILAAGMSRSASTWLYNAARLLVSGSPEQAKEFSCGWVGDLKTLPKKRIMLIKLHGFDQRLVDLADKIVYSHRDIRDSLASSERKFGHAPSMERADRLVRLHEQWIGVADFVMGYEAMQSNKVNTVVQLAGALQIENFDSRAIVDEIDQLDYSSPGPKNRYYHEVNLLHAGHFTNGGNGVWRSSGKDELFREIEKKHLRRFEQTADSPVS